MKLEPHISTQITSLDSVKIKSFVFYKFERVTGEFLKVRTMCLVVGARKHYSLANSCKSYRKLMHKDVRSSCTLYFVLTKGF